MRRLRYSMFVAFVGAALAAGCARHANHSDDEPATPDNVTVYVVNYPLKYFAERIGGQRVNVVLPVPPDVDPAHWRPPPDKLTELQTADLILLNGASYAKWTRTVSLPPSRLLNTSKALSDQYVKLADTVTHAHGPTGAHSHHGTAAMTWLDPMMALAQADAVRATLGGLRPPGKQDFDQGFRALERDLQTLDARLTEVTSARRDRPVLLSHPIFQYLTRRYQLNTKSINWEPTEMPSEAMWQELAALRQQHPAEWMIWEAEPSLEIVRRLESLGIKSIVFDPCGNLPAQGDYLQAMQRNIDQLTRVYASDD